MGDSTTDSFTVVWCDGLKFILHESEYNRIRLAINNNTTGWMTLIDPTGFQVDIDTQKISAYFISTKESRDAYNEWTRAEDESNKNEWE